jgi:hypothetical protein
MKTVVAQNMQFRRTNLTYVNLKLSAKINHFREHQVLLCEGYRCVGILPFRIACNNRIFMVARHISSYSVTKYNHNGNYEPNSM